MMINPVQWRERQLDAVPAPWRGRVAKLYRRKLGEVEKAMAGQGHKTRAEQAANLWLSDVAASMRKIRVPVGLSDAELIERAEECARMAWALAESAPGHFLTVDQLRARLARYVETFGILPPGEKVESGPAISRMTSPEWWRRALRVSQARELERVGVSLGYVHKAAEIYATDATVERRQQQRRRNAAALENTLAINRDTGQEYTLAALAALSVANPRIRRGELMTRINGFESVARGLGHIAEFVTLTCPSRFHRMRKINRAPWVAENPKHGGETPRDAQKYLGQLWARLRAKLARMGLKVYGFRIAEPHHDATPHWHLLLFMPAYLRPGASARARFRAVFRRYALKDSGEETGAKKHRCTFEAIDWNRGTAAGYVAKYVSKNIDGGGYQVQGDIEGDMQKITPSHRVEAWASTWGIRQFQQVGGPPVGVWRELRRMDEKPGAPEVLEQARSAADVGNWARYVEVMGGPVVARAALPLRAAYESPERLNRYGEQAAPVVVGVRFSAVEYWPLGLCTYAARVEGVAESRRYQWEIKRGARGASYKTEGGAGCFENGGFKGARVEREKIGGGVGFQAGRVARGPRTCVNNCTRTDSVPWEKGGLREFRKPVLSQGERETLESWEIWRGGGGNVAAN